MAAGDGDDHVQKETEALCTFMHASFTKMNSINSTLNACQLTSYIISYFCSIHHWIFSSDICYSVILPKIIQNPFSPFKILDNVKKLAADKTRVLVLVNVDGWRFWWVNTLNPFLLILTKSPLNKRMNL